MKKEEFLKKLSDQLELEDVEINENSSLNLTSLMNLSLMSFLDENFGLRIKASELKGIDSVNKIISLIGEEKLE
jgi:acyl carrier protein